MNRVNIYALYGDAPSFDEIDIDHPRYDTIYRHALNWISVIYSPGELKDFTIEYLGNENLLLLPDYRFSAIGKICSLRLRGVPLKPGTESYFKEKLEELKIYAEEVRIAQTKIVVKKQSTKIYHWQITGMIEDMIDNDAIKENHNAYFDLIAKNKTKLGLLTYLQHNFKSALEEMNNARSEELEEYFEQISDTAIEKRRIAYTRILDDIRNCMENRRAARKPKQGGQRIAKSVQHVQYKTADADLNITSVDPMSIVGATVLLAYNTQSRKVSMFMSDTGLTISGTTVKDFNPEKSFTKILRKPEMQVASFRNAGSIKRITVSLDNINAKSHPVTGRLNKDTLLLKVFN